MASCPLNPPRPPVVFDDVVKDYPQRSRRAALVRAVGGVSFHIEPGEIFGLVGPNRAGKTTLVKLLLSLCQPTHGHVQRLGRPSADRETLRRVGYVHENPAFPKYLSATALLHYYGALTLLPEEKTAARAAQLLEQVGLADRAREPIRRFSKGMLQRLGLAQALLNEPELLVLDEPSEGLDLDGRQLLRQVLEEQRARGRSALYVTHLLPEVERVCDRVGVMVAGRLHRVAAVVEWTRHGARPMEAALQEHYRGSDN